MKKTIDDKLQNIINESIREVLKEENEPSFLDHFNNSKKWHNDYAGGNYGFELMKDNEWQYGDIEYDPNTQTMSCMGISISISPNMRLIDAEEALYEALLENGFNEDYD